MVLNCYLSTDALIKELMHKSVNNLVRIICNKQLTH